MRLPAYWLTLTPDELRSLEWLEAHGYACRLLACATLQRVDADTGCTVLAYCEANAWEAVCWPDERYGADDPDYGTCAPPALLHKMLAFRASIV